MDSGPPAGFQRVADDGETGSGSDTTQTALKRAQLCRPMFAALAVIFAAIVFVILLAANLSWRTMGDAEYNDRETDLGASPSSTLEPETVNPSTLQQGSVDEVSTDVDNSVETGVGSEATLPGVADQDGSLGAPSGLLPDDAVSAVGQVDPLNLDNDETTGHSDVILPSGPSSEGASAGDISGTPAIVPGNSHKILPSGPSSEDASVGDTLEMPAIAPGNSDEILPSGPSSKGASAGDTSGIPAIVQGNSDEKLPSGLTSEGTSTGITSGIPAIVPGNSDEKLPSMDAASAGGSGNPAPDERQPLETAGPSGGLADSTQILTGTKERETHLPYFHCGAGICAKGDICCQSRTIDVGICCTAWSICRFSEYDYDSTLRYVNSEGKGSPRCYACTNSTDGDGCVDPYGGSAYYKNQDVNGDEKIMNGA